MLCVNVHVNRKDPIRGCPWIQKSGDLGAGGGGMEWEVGLNYCIILKKRFEGNQIL